MVLMAMGNHKALHLMNLGLDVADIRNNQINSQHIICREGQSAVHDNHGILCLNGSDVHTDLIQSAQGDYLHRALKAVLGLSPLCLAFRYLHGSGEQWEMLRTVNRFVLLPASGS